MLDKLKKKISELETKKLAIINDIKEGNITVEGIIRAGKELELIRDKIWAIEEAIHN